MQPDDHPERKDCAWCGKPAKRYVLVQDSLQRMRKGKIDVIAAAEYAPACAFHAATVQRSERPTVVRAKNAARAKGWKSKQEKLC